MRKKIYVSRRSIKEGEATEYDSCPVAIALKKAGLKYPCVTETDISFYYYKNYNMKNPRSVERFVSNFDSGKPVKPFSFFIYV